MTIDVSPSREPVINTDPSAVDPAARRARPVVGVGVATAAAFVVSAIWYALWAGPYQQILGTTSTAMPWWLVAAELSRSLFVAATVTLGVRALRLHTWTAALKAALLTWLAFPVVLLFGSVVHEGVSPLLAAIHAGDWLVKLVVITVVVRRFAGRTR